MYKVDNPEESAALENKLRSNREAEIHNEFNDNDDVNENKKQATEDE